MTLLIALAMFTAGCDRLTGVPETGSASGTGTMKVLLTDAPFPFDLVDEANVSISKVELISESEGRFVLSDETTSYNLLDLRDGVTTDLTEETELPSGQYHQIRLSVDDASIQLNDGRSFDVKVPSGTIRILLNDFVVESDGSVSLTLDFDAGESFVVQGNPDTPAGIKGFLFKPVVKPIGWQHDDREEMQVTGIIDKIGTGFIVVGGTEYVINDDTEFDGFSGLDDLLEEDEVEIEFVQDGGTYYAVEIERKKDDGREDDEAEEDDDGQEEDDDDASETEDDLTGTVDEVNLGDDGSSYLIVAGTKFTVDGDTQFEGVAGLEELAVGVTVEVDYVVEADGSYRALKVESESDDDKEEDNDDSGSSSDADDDRNDDEE